MKILQLRFRYSETEVLSLCIVDNVFQCYILEPKNCIPLGIYDLQLRKEGGHHQNYEKKYDFHKGMIEIKDVPGRKFILYHVGNYYWNTEGCNLTGYTIFKAKDLLRPERQIFAVGSSENAYIDLYNKIVDEVEKYNCHLHIIAFQKGMFLGEHIEQYFL